MSNLPPSEDPVPKVSRHKKPSHLTLEDWQVALRKRYGRQQHFEIENEGNEPVFSDFVVTNPESGSTYRVAIRGSEPGVNFCSCPDFATNHLGTCKHIEWTLLHLEEQEGTEALRDVWVPPFSEVYLQYGSQRVIRFQPGTECPLDLLNISSEWFDDRGVLRDTAWSGIDQFIEAGRESDHDFRCYEDAIRFIAEVRDETAREDAIVAAMPEGIESPRFDSLLKTELYPYQKEGAWFAVRAGRCLIGDEMGLGKTVQALAATELMADLLGVRAVLVVCPASLKHQWATEIENLTERDVTIIDGSPTQRKAGYASSSFFKVTNYDVIHSDLETLNDVGFDLVILDEAQRIRNQETRTARSVKQLDSRYAIVLTGTPLESRLEELVSIIQFIDRHRLGPMYRFLHRHQERDRTGHVVGYRNLAEISETLAPILIRRRKQDVLKQLPGRIEKLVRVPMSAAQRSRHDRERESIMRLIQRWRRLGNSLPEPEQRSLMGALNVMRMACDGVEGSGDDNHSPAKTGELVELLTDMLEEEGVKVVIFSEWKKTLQQVGTALRDAGLKPLLFHGGLKTSDRQQVLASFEANADQRVLLSTDSGSVGLNLHAASVVINFDLPWHASRYEQRVATVHHPGRTTPVRVLNMISECSIESSIHSLLDQATSLTDEILHADGNDLFLRKDQVAELIERIELVFSRIPRPQPATPPVRNTPTLTTSQKSSTLHDVLMAGSQFLKGLAEGLDHPVQKGIQFATDEETGEHYLRLPVSDTAEFRADCVTLSQLLQRMCSELGRSGSNE